MIPVDADLDALFKRLHLANARHVWRDLVQRAERDTWTYRDFPPTQRSRRPPTMDIRTHKHLIHLSTHDALTNLD